MNDIQSMLKMLHRPRILIRAARHGLVEYNRNHDLKRILCLDTLPSSGRALMTLIDEESLLEKNRKLGEASYSVLRHIEVLIALLGEAQIFTEETSTKRPNLTVVP